jgi:hypothetical protein
MLYLHEKKLSVAGPHCNSYNVTFTLHSSCHIHTHIRTPPKQMRHLATRIDRKSLSNTSKFETIHLRERRGRHFIRYPFFLILLKPSYDTTRAEDEQLYGTTADSVSLCLQLFIVYNFPLLCRI